jgi:hypothetical protein
MRISRISMIGNELSFAGLIMNQNVRFFDQNYLTFHNSFDGTLEQFEQEPNTQITISNLTGYPQSTLTSGLLGKAFIDGADVCIPLDADEFLPFKDRQQLENFLEPYIGNYDYLKISWRNCAPVEFPISPNLDNLKYAHPHSNIHKVFVFRSAFEKDEKLELSQGNHLIASKVELKGVHSRETYLIHIPFRSQLHYAQKVLQGAAVMFDENEHDLSDQWIDGAKQPFLTHEELMRVALDYGEPICKEHNHLYDQNRIFEKENIFQDSGDIISFNLVMQKYWSRINNMLASVPDTSFNALEIKQIKRRLAKFNSWQLIVLRVKEFSSKIKGNHREK